jgi:arginyl-tRNA synthetase
MNIYKLISEKIKDKLQTVPELQNVLESASWNNIVVEVPKNRDFGDFSTNVAMVLSKELKKNPREIANLLYPYIKDISEITDVSIAGPGFINMNVSAELWENLIKDILIAPKEYGNSDIGGGEKINVEFLSANPTGPVHIGHARGAILGDVLARLLKKNGFDVTKEYYINDYGHQVDVLAHSVFWRYQELFGLHDGEALPEGAYPGDYLIPVAKDIKDKDGDKWLNAPEDEYVPYFKKIAAAAMMVLIKNSLRKIGIEFDVFTSERELVESKQVEKTLEYMKSQGLLYKGSLPKPLGESDEDWVPTEQLLFKATEFGDDSDRVIARSNGETTYFASDIAYHLNKFNRGFKKQINVWGADHGGYVKRIKAALGAVTDNQATLDIVLCQIVNLEKDGKPFKMSKRAGNFVMIEDVLDEIDADVLRLFMIIKGADTQMTFDLEKAKEQSKDNPVYYMQYAYARACSVLKKYETIFPGSLDTLSDLQYNFASGTDIEHKLIKMLGDYPSMVESAGKNKAPNLLTKYLEEISATFHSLWSSHNGVKLINENDKTSTTNHMLMVLAFKNVIANGLETLGCTLKESM